MLTAQDYRNAVQIQDACNLSGVVQSFAEVLPRIWETVRAQGLGTAAVNKHPISVLYASKLASLTACEAGLNYHAAYVLCQSYAVDDAYPPENVAETSTRCDGCNVHTNDLAIHPDNPGAGHFCPVCRKLTWQDGMLV